jgi:hypothetical protein
MNSDHVSIKEDSDLALDSISPSSLRRGSGSSLQTLWSGSTDSLKTQLRRARKECFKRNPNFFIPINSQNELLTKHSIAKEIYSNTPDIIGEEEALEFGEKACQSSKHLCATLVYIGKGSEIGVFLKEGITDQDLPFVRLNDGSFMLQRHSGIPIKTLEQWNDEDLEYFEHVQYWMTAAIFHKGQHYSFKEETILPFMKFKPSEVLQPKEGKHSEVFPVRIHPAHHDFWEASGPDVGTCF